jgi:hypothetical protein
LEVLQHVTVDAHCNEFLRIGNGGARRGRFRGVSHAGVLRVRFEAICRMRESGDPDSSSLLANSEEKEARAALAQS